MRCLVRNKSKFYYSSYIDKTEITDENGNLTGEYNIHYSKPYEGYGNVSAAQGEVQSRQFGESVSYDKVIVLDDKDTPIDEYARLWVDTLPLLAEDGTTATPHDYVVTAVASSLNWVAIAIRKVEVNG